MTPRLAQAVSLLETVPMDANARRLARYVAVALPEEIAPENLPQAMCQAVRNPDWNVETVSEALNAAGPDDLSAYTLRSIASRLRGGATVAEVVAVLSVPESLVRKVGVWLGAVEARQPA